jgi:hypothetical protein
MIRIFQAIFLTLLITAYGLLAGACLWRFARDAFLLIFQTVETRVRLITRHWRGKLNWGSGEARVRGEKTSGFSKANASQQHSSYSGV